mmetsp:Transcript_30200/g.63681  ORF Transcript_30200/g.63681 Transcript_30200/m.63681 type:complete len:507 (-) Transcript_30200:42-1562(-)
MASSSTKAQSPLPSTTDEIPKSDIRRHPLTSEELRDIRTLIGAAKKGTTHDHAAGSTSSQQPLSGRRVMVPLTSKAFFEGTLQPKNAGADAMQEQIIVNGGSGEFVEMTRAEADVFFAKQQAQADGSATKNSNKKTTKKSVLKEPSIKSNNTQKAATTKPASSTPKESPVPPTAGPMLPFMEIRETCDSSGNILNSEVVNMSNTMKRLGDGLKNVGAGGDVRGEVDDGKQFGELLAQTLKEGERDITKDAHQNPITITEDVKEMDAQTESNKEKAKPISDADYEALCTRLEELERLEAADAKSKKENAKSSKRLQSGGWSKGFLNSAPKKKSPKKKQTIAKQTEADGNEAIDRSKSDSPEKASRISFSNTTTTIPKSDNVPSEKTSRVSFSTNDKVKEIPRIGQLKVPPRLASTQRSVNFNKPSDDFVSAVDPFAPVNSVPFEENVFRGVVKERSSTSSNASSSERDVVKQQKQPSTTTGAPSPGDNAGGKKKLSRFAQRRLERGE